MTAIDPALILQGKLDEPVERKSVRGYMGMSSIGNECAAKIWFDFRMATKPKPLEGRISRLFERGHMEEARMIASLKKTGLEVFLVNEDGEEVEMTGALDEQQETLVGYKGHAKGHPDGRVRNVPTMEDIDMLLEMKTAGESSFKKLCKVNDILQWNRTYYGQCQRYMKEMGLSHTLFLVTNKNTDAYKVVIAEFDQGYADDLERKEEYLIDSNERLPPFYPRGHWRCDFCPHVLTCHLNVPADKNCRTCKSSKLLDDGKWKCTKFDKELSLEKQIEGCEKHSALI
jgi:hypothetical protein